LIGIDHYAPPEGATLPVPLPTVGSHRAQPGPA
jgi:hypothetical protein